MNFLISILLPLLFTKTSIALPETRLPQRFRVAYVGDVSIDGLKDGLSGEVMQLIVDEGAELLVIGGDLTYLYEYGIRVGIPDFLVNQTGPDVFVQQVDEILGEDFPVFAVPGNADETEWESFDVGTPDALGLKERLWERLERTELSKHCEPALDFGRNSICYYKGILFVLSGLGSLSSLTVDDQGDPIDQLQFLEDSLEHFSGQTVWKVCVFHKVQNLFQTFTKEDELPGGYEAYEICRRHGAAVHTAHSHNYARTKTMIEYSDSPRIHSQNSNLNPIILRNGTNYNVLNGVGGFNIVEHADGLEENEWWATALALNSDPPLQHGVVICEYNTTPPPNWTGKLRNTKKRRKTHTEHVMLQDDDVTDPRLASCYFKQVDGTVRDTWYIKSLLRKT